ARAAKVRHLSQRLSDGSQKQFVMRRAPGPRPRCRDGVLPHALNSRLNRRRVEAVARPAALGTKFFPPPPRSLVMFPQQKRDEQRQSDLLKPDLPHTLFPNAVYALTKWLPKQILKLKRRN